MQIIERLAAMNKTEAIALLKGGYADLCAAVESTLESTCRNAIVSDDDSQRQRLICGTVSALRRLGYARLEPLIDDRDVLAAARAYAKSLPHRADSLQVGDAGVHDVESGGAEGKAGDAFVFDTKLFHAHGRPIREERNTATIDCQLPATPLNLFYMKYHPEGQVI